MEEKTLTAKAARRLIRSTRKAIFAWVNLHADDGAYIQVQKGSLLASIHPDSEAKYFINDREDAVYIN